MPRTRNPPICVLLLWALSTSGSSVTVTLSHLMRGTAAAPGALVVERSQGPCSLGRTLVALLLLGTWEQVNIFTKIFRL